MEEFFYSRKRETFIKLSAIVMAQYYAEGTLSEGDEPPSMSRLDINLLGGITFCLLGDEADFLHNTLRLHESMGKPPKKKQDEILPGADEYKRIWDW